MTGMVMRNTFAAFAAAVFFMTATDLSAQISATRVEGADKSDVEDIVIVFKMHFDIGYTDWSEAVLQKYTTSMIGQALGSVERTACLPEEEQFVWTLPGWPMKYILENTEGEVRAAAEDAVRTGRFAVHALPFTFETESSDLETLVRGMEFSSGINREYGLPLPRGAKLTDVPSHSWILPTILSHAGVKILHIGCNSGSASPEVPVVFWWEGPDGSRLLTFNWAEYYGSGVMPPENWPYKTWLAMIHTHENTGAPTPEEVAAVLAEARAKAPGARIRIGRLEDFYDALMAENPDIPVVRGDMPDTWIHGYMSMPDAVKINKHLQRTIYQTEALNTLLGDWGVQTSDCSGHVDDAVEQSLLFDEHTFGLALSHGRQEDWKYGDDFKVARAKGGYGFIEESWYEKEAHAHNALHSIIPVRRRDMAALAGAVAVEGRRVVVYNQLPWARSGFVSFPLEVYQKNFKVTALKDAVTGEVIPVEDSGNILSFHASDVPAMGYRTYSVMTGDADTVPDDGFPLELDSLSGVIGNRYFRVAINTDDGSLLSVLDRLHGTELADSDGQYGFGEYIHERFGNEEIARYNSAYVKPSSHGWADQEMGRPVDPALEYSCSRGRVSHIRYDISDVSVSATAFCHIDAKPGQEREEYLMTYTLYRESPYLEINWYPDVYGTDPQPEAGWLAFPSGIEGPRFRLGRTGAVVDPSSDFVRNTNTDYCFVNTGLAVTGSDGNGIGLNSPDAPAVSLGRPGLYRFSRDYVPEKADIFVNLYNTQWGTNFREWIADRPSATVYVWPVREYDNASSLITPVEETRSPMFAAYSDGNAGELPPSMEGVSVSEEGVLVTAFRGSEDSTLLRLWEQAGTDRECAVTLPAGVYGSAALCDLRGTVLEQPVPLDGDTLTVSLKAYSPLSVILYRKP